MTGKGDHPTAGMPHSTYTPATLHADNWLPEPAWKALRPLQNTLAPLAGMTTYDLRHAVFPGPDCRILFVSDLHWYGKQPRRFDQLAKALNELRADWVIFGGDLASFMDLVDAGIEWLGRLQARRGKLAVRGNHEAQIHWRSSEFWRGAYAEGGFQLLRNELRDNGMDPIFFGLDDARFGTPDWGPIQTLRDSPRPVITVSQNPDGPASLPDETFLGSLVLCGHTHGGQICPPLLGPLYTSSKYGRQFVRGWSERGDGTLLYTTTGIGEAGFGILRRRVRCRPEAVLIEFRAASR